MSRVFVHPVFSNEKRDAERRTEMRSEGFGKGACKTTIAVQRALPSNKMYVRMIQDLMDERLNSKLPEFDSTTLEAGSIEHPRTMLVTYASILVCKHSYFSLDMTPPLLPQGRQAQTSAVEPIATTVRPHHPLHYRLHACPFQRARTHAHSSCSPVRLAESLDPTRGP
jgi:hypothetical protein